MDWYQIVWMICIMLPFTYYGISLSKPTKGKMIFGVNISHELTKAPVIKRVRKSYNLMFLLGQLSMAIIWLGFTILSERFITWLALMLVLFVIQLYATFYYGHTLCMDFKYIPIEVLDEGIYELDKEDIVIRRELEYTSLIRQEFTIVYTVVFLTTIASLVFYPLIPELMEQSAQIQGEHIDYLSKNLFSVSYYVGIQIGLVACFRILTGYIAHKKRYVNPAYHMLAKGIEVFGCSLEA